MHPQKQPADAVTAPNAVQRVRIPAGLGAIPPVPAEYGSVTDVRRILAQMVRMQLQHHPENAVAAERGLQAVRIDAGFHQLPAVPHIGMPLATVQGVLIEIDRIHTEIKPIDAVAAVTAFKAVGIDPGLCQLAAAPQVHAVVADRNNLLKQVGGMHLQPQTVNAVATMLGLQAVGIPSGSGQTPAAPHICPTVTNLKGVGMQEGGMHIQLQPVDAVAAINGLQAVPDDIAADSLPPDGDRMAFPHEQLIVTNIHGIRKGMVRMNRKQQPVNAVTSGLCFQAVPDDIAAGRTPPDADGMSFPDIGLMVADFSHFRKTVGGMHRQGQFEDTVTAVFRLQAVPVLVAAGLLFADADRMARPYIPFVVADGDLLFGVIIRIYP